MNNTTTATMLTALPATPAENDVVYASELIYPEEDATSSANVFTGLRMQFQSAGAIYRAWGCVATALSFTMPVGAVPKVAITYAAAKMIPIGSAPTWPPATAKDEFSGQPIGGGSLFLQDHGTATRATKTITDFTLDVDLGTSLIRGHGTADVYQNIIKAVRTKCQASFSFTTLSDASGTNTEYDAWNSDTGNLKHALYGASVGRDGASLGFYFPYCTQVGAAPSQVIEGDVNRIRSSFLCGTNTVTTNSLTLANFVIGLG